MREADKPPLAYAIWITAKATEMPAPSNREEIDYVLDGGALIQRLPWSQNATFDSIKCNKRKFIFMVSAKFQHRGFQTIHAEGDDDLPSFDKLQWIQHLDVPLL